MDNKTNKKQPQTNPNQQRDNQKDSQYTGDKKLGGPNRPAE
jgi:hypothetical protein